MLVAQTPPAVGREAIAALEKAMRTEIQAGNFEDIVDSMALEHFFIPGVYARQLTVPAGTVIVGRVHLHPCFTIIMTGEVTVHTAEGRRTITGPVFFRTEAGAQRAVYAHTESVWITIHRSDKTDLDDLKAELTCATFEDFERLTASPQEKLA